MTNDKKLGEMKERMRAVGIINIRRESHFFPTRAEKAFCHVHVLTRIQIYGALTTAISAVRVRLSAQCTAHVCLYRVRGRKENSRVFWCQKTINSQIKPDYCSVSDVALATFKQHFNNPSTLPRNTDFNFLFKLTSIRILYNKSTYTTINHNAEGVC